MFKTGEEVAFDAGVEYFIRKEGLNKVAGPIKEKIQAALSRLGQEDWKARTARGAIGGIGGAGVGAGISKLLGGSAATGALAGGAVGAAGAAGGPKAYKSIKDWAESKKEEPKSKSKPKKTPPMGIPKKTGPTKEEVAQSNKPDRTPKSRSVVYINGPEYSGYPAVPKEPPKPISDKEIDEREEERRLRGE